MTRIEAVAKIVKLQKLAHSNSNPNEADTARSQAFKLMQEYSITHNDLSDMLMGSAFDDLIDSLQRITTAHPDSLLGCATLLQNTTITQDLVQQLKSGDVHHKKKKLQQLAFGIRALNLFGGSSPVVAEIKSSLDTVLRNYEITL